MADSQRTPESEFWSLVDRGGDCWLWLGRKNSTGYGALGRKYPDERAHRYAWLITHGPIPDGLWVLHRCDNPPCVRPEHLFLGDALANARDRDAKGRDRNGREGLTHCKRGHPFNLWNTRFDSRGTGRSCWACHYARPYDYEWRREYQRKRYRAKRDAELAAKGKD
jgi:hypothetical protein